MVLPIPFLKDFQKKVINPKHRDFGETVNAYYQRRGNNLARRHGATLPQEGLFSQYKPV